ncbi:hypothetical protein AB0H76_34710 [Nocardia sp. NPDC050712]|uniref:hypothetical protein n=1 Tax=Nocardia sp. NPDC050712 TaxID=3155518 RepID=UPI0033E4226F
MDTEASPVPSVTSYTATTGTLRHVALMVVRDSVDRVWAVQAKQHAEKSEHDYEQDHGYQLPEGRSDADLVRRIHEQTRILAEEFPECAEFADRSAAYADGFADPATAGPDLLRTLREFMDDEEHYTPDAHHGRGAVELAVDGDSVTIELNGPGGEPVAASRYLRAVSELLTTARAEGRRLTHTEEIAVQFAYLLLDQGARPEEDYQLWGVPGFRAHQTFLSITDPGEGHVLGSTMRAPYLDGTVVHVEHIERAESEDREVCEPYRLPSIHTIARVRLHIGTSAPLSVYVGRPMFEGDFEASRLKSVRFMAAVCSLLFQAGAAECKVSMEHMTAGQAVCFMRAVAADTLMNPHRQTLSAAFNLNNGFVDDRGPGKPRKVKDRLGVGRLGIELARAGGFGKVAWDGAGDAHPSKPIIEQLGHADAATLVHEAHSAGLLTYMSAGISFDELADVVYTGVDAVGIGSALHYKDSETGFHGPFIEEHITRLSHIRDHAEASVRGQAAWLLARLDRMHYEGSLPTADEPQREALAEAVIGYKPGAASDERLQHLLEQLEHIASRPSDTRHPYLAWTMRLLDAGNTCVAARDTDTTWTEQLDVLERLAGQEDLEELQVRLRAVSPVASLTSAL